MLFQTQSKASLQSSFLLLRNVKKEAADGGAVAPAGVAVTAEYQGGRAVSAEAAGWRQLEKGHLSSLEWPGSKERAVKIERGREKVEGRD